MSETIKGIEGKTKIETSTGTNTTAQPNALDKFASFTQIFTWSSLTRDDLYTLEYRKSNYKPKNVIARTGGISGQANTTLRSSALNGTIKTTGDATILEATAQQNRDEAAGLLYARQVLELGRDLFFERVSINTVPAANDSRPMTAVTGIEMEVHEPLGLSLVSKMRGAAYNCNFDNHVTAPYLLTIEYEGWDTNGQSYKIDRKYSRQIPIKIVGMEVNVNQGGAIYQIRAVPFNEFGFVDRFNKVTSDIKINSGTTLKEFCQALTKALNEVVETEVNQRYYQLLNKDQFLVTCDPKFSQQKFNTGNDKITNSPMGDQNQQNRPNASKKVADDKKYETAKQKYKQLGQIGKGTAITSVLKDAMRLIYPYDSYENLVKAFNIKADGALADTIDKWVTQDGDFQIGQFADRQAFLRKNEDAFYVETFRITTNVKILEGFDYKTKDHKKIIHFHIEPYKIHILNYSQPGLPGNFDRYKNLAAQANQFASRKIYNYIFSGDNKDILNIDLRYNVAYFSPMYKSPDPQQWPKNSDPGTGIDTGRDANTQKLVEAELPDHQYRIYGGKTANSGIFGVNPALDLWIDGFTNPEGDMVNVEMEIRGDPAYISSNQFNPVATPDFSGEGPGEWTNTNRSSKNGTSETYDEDTESYNLNSAEPYVVLNYRFPVDIDMRTGEYLLNQSQRSPFNGLYKVYGVEHVFDRGQFKQRLKMNRFKNQGNRVGNPISNQYTEGAKGNISIQLKDFQEEFKGYFGIANTIGESIQKIVDKVKNLVNKITGN